MYVVRRHSRKLFFPAGLLALAWLLVLGCALIARNPPAPLQTSVMLSLMPLGNKMKNTFDAYDKGLAVIWNAFYGPSAHLETLRSWHTVEFTGNPWQDYYSARLTSFYLQHLTAAPDVDAGVRIRLQPKTTYRQLVTLLDEFTVAGFKSYYVDFRSEPATLYLITRKPEPFVLDPGGCLVMAQEPAPPRPEPTWLDRIGQLSALLVNPESHQTPLLIAALAVAGVAALRLLAAAGLELRQLRTARL
ncbi:hypothetical protein [Hymenobacter sp. B81]|uniref:hypothetical protein n=1 Tax=Hymenobacter sp. B81 TaxID=3344878 RepID=UPI0037DD162B